MKLREFLDIGQRCFSYDETHNGLSGSFASGGRKYNGFGDSPGDADSAK